MSNPRIGSYLQHLIVEKDQNLLNTVYTWTDTRRTDDQAGGKLYNLNGGEMLIDICLCLARMGKLEYDVPEYFKDCGVRLHDFCAKYHQHDHEAVDKNDYSDYRFYSVEHVR
jgi:hypothetical protein